LITGKSSVGVAALNPMTRLAFACAVLGAAMHMLIDPAGAQPAAGPPSACSAAELSCTHELGDMKEALISSLPSATYAPLRPGKYTFRFEAQDLCAGRNATVTVDARCPPKPAVNITSSIFPDTTVKQGGTIKFSASAALGQGWKSAGLTYTWSIKAPAAAGADYGKGSDSATADYTTPVLFVPGDYYVDLQVSDGCSSQITRSCFSVVCSCGPTANAGATSTVWSNTGKDVTNAFNIAGSAATFVLDGSLSSDFDLLYSNNEVLSYDWSLLSWTPAPPSSLQQGALTDGGRAAFPFTGWFQTTRPDPSAQPVWNTDNTLMPNATATNFGYRVIYNGVPLKKSYTFRRLARTVLSGDVVCSTETARSNTCDTYTASTLTTLNPRNDVGYPTWVPKYNQEGLGVLGAENFMSFDWPQGKKPEFNSGSTAPNIDPTTTSGMAWVSRQVSVSITTETHYNVTTHTSGIAEPDADLCEVRITQSSSTSPIAGLNIYNPSFKAMDRPTFLSETGAFEACRGILRLQLTVKDSCKSSTDSFFLTVRCNRPPVAAACCNSTVVWRESSSSFDQFTVDGRLTQDWDRDSLVYYWSFISYPPRFQAPCAASLGKACEQDFCQKVVAGTGATWYIPSGDSSSISRAFGNTTRRLAPANTPQFFSGVTGYNSKCAPNVYPVVYDLSSPISLNGHPTCVTPGTPIDNSKCTSAVCPSWCGYPAVSNTEFHEGQLAYFKPTAQGRYEVQLAVFDGCSVTTDVVAILAVCPEINATAVAYKNADTTPLTTASGVMNTDSFRLAAPKYDYAGNLRSKLTFTWGYTTQQSSTIAFVGITAGTDPDQATFKPPGAGVYSMFAWVSDGCWSSPATEPAGKRFTGPVITVACGARPASAILSSTTDVQYNAATKAFASQTISINNVDNSVTYTWTVSRLNASSQLETVDSKTGTSYVFAPVLNFALGSSVVYTITVSGFDGCQTTATSTRTITASCSNSMSVIIPDLVPVNYDFKSSSFPQVAIAVDASSVFPYPTQNAYTWCITAPGGNVSEQCRNVNEPAAVSATQNKQTNFQFAPSLLGDYTVRLTVNDGCTEKAAVRVLKTSCPQRPTAAMTLVPAGASVEWDSFATKYNGAFPELTLDGLTSKSVTGFTAADGVASLVYDFTGKHNLASSESAIGNINGQAKFTPTLPGTYTFRLRVVNGAAGKCFSEYVATSVSTVCLNIAVNVKLFSGSSTTPASTAVQSKWNGLGFDMVNLDGTDIKYTSPSNSNKMTNLNILRYEWLVLAAPQGSMFLPSQNSSVEFTPATGFNYKTLSADAVPPADQNYTIKTQYTRTRTATQVMTTTTIFNHHYNRPMTCFRPDVPGVYTIKLTVRDGCRSVEAPVITIQSACNPIGVPTPSVRLAIQSTSLVGTTLTLTGSKYERVILDGRGAKGGSDCDTLTYQWSCSVPIGSTAGITNPNGNIVSIAPDKPGDYKCNFTVNDGCQSVQRAVSFNVLCPSPDIPSRASPSVNVTGQTNPIATDIYFVDATKQGNSQFGGAYWTLRGFDIPLCAVLKRSWYFQDRKCTTNYALLAAVPTPAPVQSCPINRQCGWKVTKFPCGWASSVAFKNPTNCTKEGCDLPTVGNTCAASFKCNSAGTYELQFTVADGCSTVVQKTTVSCKCKTCVFADIPAAQTITRQCVANADARDWPATVIAGAVITANSGTNGCALPACAAPPAVSAAVVAPKGSCCPAIRPCSSCNTCPSCPVCPSGPGVQAFQGSAGLAGTQAGSVEAVVPGAIAAAFAGPQLYTVARNDVAVSRSAETVVGLVPGALVGVETPGVAPAMVTPVAAPAQQVPGTAFASGEALVDEEMSTDLMLGVLLPISAVIIASVVGNLLLVRKLQKVNALLNSKGRVSVLVH